MAKITKIERKDKEYNGKKSTSYIGTLDDGTTGFFNPKFDTEFREGDDVSYTKAEKTGKNGAYFVLTLSKLGTSASAQSGTSPSQPQRPEIHVGTGKSKQELKVEATIRMAETVIRGFFNDKVESANIATLTKEYSRMLASEIDEIFSSK